MSKDREDTFVRSGIHLFQTPEVSQRLDLDLSSPTPILDNITSYPGAEFGSKTPEQFMRHFVTRIKQFPNEAHLLFVDGESGNGKSRLIDEIMASMLLLTIPPGKKHTELTQFARDNGYTVRLHSVPWGDASEHLPKEWMIDPTIGYHDDPTLHAAKQFEVARGEEVKATVLAEEIKASNDAHERGLKTIDIYVGDDPVVTGDIIDGQPVGILRAYNMMQEIRHKRGRFRGLKYRLSTIMLNASTEVREEAFSDRTIITAEDLTEEERRAALAERGKLIGNDSISVKDAAQEPASPRQMELLQRDTNDVLIIRYARSDPRLRPGLKAEHDITEDMLNARGDSLRVPMLGAIQHPHLLKNVLGYSEQNRRVGNFYNGVKVTGIRPFPELTYERPIVQRRDRIIQAIGDREEQARIMYGAQPQSSPQFGHDYY